MLTLHRWDPFTEITRFTDELTRNTRAARFVPAVDGTYTSSRSTNEEDGDARTAVLIRDDVDVPVMMFEAETDLTLLNYAGARQPDTDLTVAVGNLLVTGITSMARGVLGTPAGKDVSVTPTIFLFYAGLTLVVAVAFSVAASFYRYRDTEAAQGR